jgi:hypothetical protein
MDLISIQSLEWDILHTIIMTSSGKGSLPHQEYQRDAICLPNTKSFDHLGGLGCSKIQRYKI